MTSRRSSIIVHVSGWSFLPVLNLHQGIAEKSKVSKSKRSKGGRPYKDLHPQHEPPALSKQGSGGMGYSILLSTIKTTRFVAP
mmetsp:Transcript_14727/g.31730  ORF Transcript_14727/g.31730 Transcript_14727/m.31730 type:complete len:83 (+) Transcript_14727:1928-2176(+)